MNSSIWVFLRPFAPIMWSVTAFFCLLVGVFVWIMEHRMNDEFHGPPKQEVVLVLCSLSAVFVAGINFSKDTCISLPEKEPEDGVFKMLRNDVTRVVNMGATALVTEVATTNFVEAGISAATVVMTVRQVAWLSLVLYLVGRVVTFNGYPEAAWAKRKKGGLTRKRSSKQSTKQGRLQQYVLTHKLWNLQLNPHPQNQHLKLHHLHQMFRTLLQKLHLLELLRLGNHPKIPHHSETHLQSLTVNHLSLLDQRMLKIFIISMYFKKILIQYEKRCCN